MIGYVHHITVSEGDTDALGHVNNVRYLQWVQDVSALHWEQLTCDDWEKQFVWVVRSHNIRYLSPAFPGDKLRIETLVKSARGAGSDREVHISHADSSTPVATCVTNWCLINKDTQLPVRIPDEMAAHLLGG